MYGYEIVNSLVNIKPVTLDIKLQNESLTTKHMHDIYK